MTDEQQRQALLKSIVLWCQDQIETHQRYLPRYEMGLARKTLKAFMHRAIDAAERQDLPTLRDLQKELPYFTMPWPVTVWYATHT